MEEEITYAFLLPGSITDSGWNAQMYVSAQSAEAALDIEIQVAYGLGQVEVADVMTEFAEAGTDVIWGHTLQYADAANQVAELYPDSWFIGTTYYQRSFSNVIGVQNHVYQGLYTCGMYAGGLTETGKIAFVGGFEFGT
ncbi:unnamed protein product, partial [marine sediment metagenome]